MFNRRLPQIVILVSLFTTLAHAELPAQVNKVFNDLSVQFKKPALQLVMEKSAKTGVSKTDFRSVMAIQAFELNEKVTVLKKLTVEALDDSMTPKQRFIVNQTKNSLSFVKSNFDSDACTLIKNEGFTKFEKNVLTEFEPTALSTGKVESEVLTKLFTMIDQMCVQVVKTTDI